MPQNCLNKKYFHFSISETADLTNLKILLNTILIIYFLFCGCSQHNRNLKINGNWEALVAQESSEPGSISRVDSSLTAFMRKYNVPGLSLAVAKDDRLIYIKALGYADTTTGEKVSPESLFRIASISKPFTSVAIMKLIQEGRLNINSKVFGDSGILGNQYGTLPYGQNITNITIDELIHHTCGGWTNDMNDPMFTNPSFISTELLSWTLNNQPLKNQPGFIYAYSNFGYFVLGRVIEKVTGQSYADYVSSNVLRPIGITDMQIGNNTKDDKKQNEVMYYGQWEDPYDFNVTRMDAHGGWIATATDLLRFIVRLDGFSLKSDILDSSVIRLMFTSSAANPKYACGWVYNDKFSSWGHNGSLPGTSSDMERTKTGFSWALLINTRLQREDFYTDFSRVMENLIDDPAIRWPEKDLF